MGGFCQLRWEREKGGKKANKCFCLVCFMLQTNINHLLKKPHASNKKKGFSLFIHLCNRRKKCLKPIFSPLNGIIETGRKLYHQGVKIPSHFKHLLINGTPLQIWNDSVACKGMKMRIPDFLFPSTTTCATMPVGHPI